MATILAAGVGVAAAAFIVSPQSASAEIASLIDFLQGRASLVAYRRSRAQRVGTLGRVFYKGGFEPKMNKREAALILQLKYF